MTKSVVCRYCGAKMVYRELGNVKLKFCFYECPQCLSRSPQTYSEIMANSMARMTNGNAAKTIDQEYTCKHTPHVNG